MRTPLLFTLALVLALTAPGLSQEGGQAGRYFTTLFGQLIPSDKAETGFTRKRVHSDLPDGQVVATPEEIALAQERLFAAVPTEVEPFFDLFLYISKARSGALKQRMFIFERGADGSVSHRLTWLVSTGRERAEKYFTATPTGLFQLDRERMFERWLSRRWDAPMPYAIFWDLTIGSGKAGIAFHASGRRDIPKLGSRASGGCVRLHPLHAEALFRYVQARMVGKVPMFPYDAMRGSTVRDGAALRDEKGQIVLRDGLKVLFFVEDFDGSPEPVVAPLVAMANGPEAGYSLMR
ncbi:MAG: L,D-transpeptidase [Alphaproteobacteria bacterium]|nr:L,D-transpeptidase [Alphaproteobacteria bacterium]